MKRRRGELATPDRMTLVEHLTELRRRLIISAVAIAAGAIVAFVAYNAILHFLIQPYCDTLPAGQKCSLYITDPLEGFVTRLKVATWVGFLLASPVVLYQLWRFITPGLNPNEKRYAIPFVLSSVALFVFGAVVAYLTFPKALQFLLSIGGTNLTPILSPSRYLRLVILMDLAFGVAFLFPVVLVFLELAGVISSRQLTKWWRPAVVVIFVIAAVITPSQDPYSLFFMAIPMCVFYAGAIVIGKLLHK
ncbi:MAG TPA: twin-arginine translocase subunit TatC [Dermatophilaceae bacterium]|nr:twin-arginine translocase subunit TatC [Dermatophilaceae bacterium]